MTLDPALALTVSLVLAAILGAAAVTKLRALDAFAGVVENYRLLPRGLVRPVTLALPPVELAAALGLLVPATRSLAAGAAVLLLLVFAAAMAVNLGRGRSDIDCGCFVGLLRQRISWALVARNLLLAACGLPLVAAAAAAADGAGRALTGLDGLTIAGGTASFLLLYAAIGRLFGVAPATTSRGAS